MSTTHDRALAAFLGAANQLKDLDIPFAALAGNEKTNQADFMCSGLFPARLGAGLQILRALLGHDASLSPVEVQAALMEVLRALDEHWPGLVLSCVVYADETAEGGLLAYYQSELPADCALAPLFAATLEGVQRLDGEMVASSGLAGPPSTETLQ